MFELNKMYNFNTKAPSILGDLHSSMKVITMTNAQEAIKYGDIHALNTQIDNSLGNVLGDINDMTFIVFTNSTGEKSVLSLSWILVNTIEEVTKTHCKFTVRDINNIDVETIVQQLNELGYIVTTEIFN